MLPDDGTLKICGLTTPDEKRGQILRFRTRGIPPRDYRRHPTVDSGHVIPLDHLAKYERGDDNEDFRDRMMANLFALVVSVMLIVCGTWLTWQLADMQP
jgi:hypothetical protein